MTILLLLFQVFLSIPTLLLYLFHDTFFCSHLLLVLLILLNVSSHILLHSFPIHIVQPLLYVASER